MKISTVIKTWITFLFLSTLFTSCIKNKKADVVVHNAVIYSVDEGFNTYQAMAITDGKIVELGAEREIMNKYRADKIYDARTQPIYPGFFDAHSHFLGAASNMAELNLFGVESKARMIEKLIIFSKSNKRKWIVGRGWDQNIWADKTFPDKAEIDSLFPDTPVYLMRIDGHAALVNQKALDLAGITGDTKLEGGEIRKDKNGKLTGIVVDAASAKVTELIPDLPKNILIENIAKVEKECFSYGLTTVTDAGITPQQIALIDSLQKKGKLLLNIYAMVKAGPGAMDLIKRGPTHTNAMSVRAIKLFADGALGSRGALLKKPYSDDPGNYGNFLLTDSIIDLYSKASFDYGFQLCTHCIGDSANAIMLRKYAEILDGVTDLRWRIEHAQVVSPSDLHYFSDYAIIPSMQPVAAVSDMEWAEDRLGPERIKDAYDLKTLKNELGFLPLGTDFPVDRMSPIENFYAAVFRKDRFGKPDDGYRMDQALTRQDALRGITIWAALASFEENEKGSLEPGKKADFVVLNRDITKVPENEILKTEVLQTFIDGKSVYRK